MNTLRCIRKKKEVRKKEYLEKSPPFFYPICAVLLCALVFAKSAEGQIADDLTADKAEYQQKSLSSASKKILPEWPMPLMTREHRSALLRLFLQNTSFVLKRFDKRKSEDNAICESVLQKLIAFQDIEILEPKIVAYSFSNEVNLSQQKRCPNLNPIRMYTPLYGDLETLIKNPIFLALPEDKKEERAPSFFQASDNFEYYDFSSYFGSGVWGYLGEGVSKRCRPDKISYCEKYAAPTPEKPYRGYLGTLAAVFNAETCHLVHYPQSLLTQRIVAFSDAPYHENPSATAFVSIGGKVYLLMLEGGVPWYRFEDIMRGGANTKIQLFPVMYDESSHEVSHQNRLCIYENGKLDIKTIR